MNLISKSRTGSWPRSVWLAGFLGLCLAACSENSDTDPSRVIRVGVLPDQNAETLHQAYDSLLTHLSEHGDQEFVLVVPEDYADLVNLFASGQIDLGYFGGVTFLQAEEKANAIPIVMRNVDREFASVFVARTDSDRKRLADFEGTRLAFGSELSTSGHLMPRHFLFAEGMGVERYFSEIAYTGAHDETAFRVRDGAADLGAMNESIYDRLVETGQLKEDEVRVIWRTPPYANYVWAARPDLGEKIIRNIRDTFLELAADDPEHAEILALVGAEFFLPAAVSDFNSLRVVAAGLGIVGVSAESGLLETEAEVPV